MTREIKEIATRYLAEINQDFEYSKLLVASIDRSNEDLIEFINDSVIISICIKYESFTSEAMMTLRNNNIAYNKPWAYTRYFIRNFKMDNLEERYELAHDAWEYYNTLKHENHKSKIDKTNFVKKHGIRNSWDALRFVHNAITGLLKSFSN